MTIKFIKKYSRTAKVQVPLLAILVYLLVCLIYPKAWIWFDWNPSFVSMAEKGFVAFNADSTRLWSRDYDCNVLNPESRPRVVDVNGDSVPEVLFVPLSPENLLCNDNSNIFVYGTRGRQLFRGQCFVLGALPVDSTSHQAFRSSILDVKQFRERTIIVTKCDRSYPARTYFRFWDGKGDSLGWYLDRGHNVSPTNYAWLSDSVFACINHNPFSNLTTLFVVNIYNCRGLSPIFASQPEHPANLEEGNQLAYVIFPSTDVADLDTAIYRAIPRALVAEAGGVLRVDVWQQHSQNAEISFVVGSNFRVNEIRFSDDFDRVRRDFVKRGSLPQITDPIRYANDMRDSVRYWINHRWVTETELRASEQILIR